MADGIDLRHHVFDAVVANWMDGHVAVTNAVLAVVRDNQALVDDHLEQLAVAEMRHLFTVTSYTHAHDISAADLCAVRGCGARRDDPIHVNSSHFQREGKS